MRILFLIKEIGRGGLQKQTLLLSKMILARFIDAEVIIVHRGISDAGFAKEFEELGCLLMHFKPIFKKELFDKHYFRFWLKRSLGSKEIALALPLSSSQFYFLSEAVTATKIKKYFFVMWGGNRSIDAVVSNKKVSKAIFRSDGVLTNSEAAISYFRKILPLLEKPYHNVPNVLPQLETKIDGERQIGLKRVLVVANFFKEKNHKLLLEAIKVLRDKGLLQGFKFHLAGRDSGDILSNNYINYIAQNHLEEIVEINLDSTKNIFELIKSSQICCLPTFTEGCPNVILEYMQFNKPIVCSDIPAIREVLTEVTGVTYFDNASVNSLVDALQKSFDVSSNLEIDYSEKLLRYTEEEAYIAFKNMLD